MLSTENIITQVKRSVQLLSATYIVLFGLLFTITMISGYYNIPISSFTRDPTVVLGGPSYIGFISNIGILFWAFTAAICLFSSVIHKQGNNQATSQFLLYSGLLTLWLLLDDLLLEQQGFEFLLEDGLKLFGIVTWFIFFFRTCRVYLQQEE